MKCLYTWDERLKWDKRIKTAERLEKVNKNLSIYRIDMQSINDKIKELSNGQKSMEFKSRRFYEKQYEFKTIEEEVGRVFNNYFRVNHINLSTGVLFQKRKLKNSNLKKIIIELILESMKLNEVKGI